MLIFTTWTCYNGEVGVTLDGEYYEIGTGKKLHQEYHKGALYYRANGSKKRYSWKKCNETKIEKQVEIIQLPF